MSTKIKKIKDAFESLYDNLLKKEFSKTMEFKYWNEQELLPLVRTFLLGFFGEKLKVECKSCFPKATSKNGRIDFIIDDIAVELAVRAKHEHKNKVRKSNNISEIMKLMKYKGAAILVLIDFSNEPLTQIDLEKYRDIPSFGKGNHMLSSFSLLYYFTKKEGRKHTPTVIRMNIK